MSRTMGWQAHIEQHFATQRTCLYLWRERGEHIEVVSGRVDPLFTIDANRTFPDDAGIWLPNGSREAIVEHLRPHHNARPEIARLEEALAVERARVDATLALLNGVQP